jgi:hypothetical protein
MRNKMAAKILQPFENRTICLGYQVMTNKMAAKMLQPFENWTICLVRRSRETKWLPKCFNHLKTGQFVWFSGHEKQNGCQKWSSLRMSGFNYILTWGPVLKPV